MESDHKVAIVGAGELGQAIGKLLRENGAAANLWDSDPSKVPGHVSLEDHISPADFVFFCIPSWAMRNALENALPFLQHAASVVAFAKGIEECSLKTMGEFLPDVLPDGQRYAVAGGPMLAKEISAGMTAVCVIASRDEGVRNELRDLLASPRCKIELHKDVQSVSLAGVLKNIYSVSLGIADGLGMSGNQKGWLVARAIKEMTDVGKVLGADPEIILGTSGVGDFIATGYSPHSRNRAVGDEIVKNGSCNLRGEGLHSLPSLTARLGERGSTFPLLHLINEVGIACKPAKPAFQAFFNGEI